MEIDYALFCIRKFCDLNKIAYKEVLDFFYARLAYGASIEIALDLTLSEYC